ncbi:16S rRNA (uracil(1498)-N(3))-methyltransferase [Marinobacter halodurans]|uniref:Ribosomal RNA small subunit methyltransferase E n=1 Tax=Marinobacter halodurans TaxID=2528979 RepID=A0ABY1ZG87_9GAMM|nr:16S rRNA (uracil(1498)-N(3))-methyltransferase [Marinobacter halodurans]TBW50757.1 16S rRNA (uracil(1498)-N(3))-methyltransferase [Marinobacter halodurans]
MRIPRIYSPVTLVAGQEIELDAHAANHVGRVLRMQPEQAIELFNGDGYDYPATLTEVGKKAVWARVGEPVANAAESPLRVHLGQVLSRGDRMDYAIQKSVEMGVARITPLVSDRCEVKLKGDREDKRLRHWQQVAISAAEQCGRAVVPVIEPVSTLADWFAATGEDDLRLVLHHRTEQSLTGLATPTRLALLVGPEGGLNEEEIGAAEQVGFIAAALGPRVLRTETAPVAALAICHWLWGDGQQHHS